MGWISIDRKIKENWVWNAEPKCRAAAWIDLIIKAHHEDESIPFNGHPLQLKRGQLLTSVRKLSKEWQWSKDKTLMFLRDLEKENMIIRDTQTVDATLITLVNYSDYQSPPDTHKDTHKDTKQYTDKDTHKDTHKDTDSPQSINKQYKQDKQENNIETATPIWGLPDWSDGDYEEISYEK